MCCLPSPSPTWCSNSEYYDTLLPARGGECPAQVALFQLVRVCTLPLSRAVGAGDWLVDWNFLSLGTHERGIPVLQAEQEKRLTARELEILEFIRKVWVWVPFSTLWMLRCRVVSLGTADFGCLTPLHESCSIALRWSCRGAFSCDPHPRAAQLPIGTQSALGWGHYPRLVGLHNSCCWCSSSVPPSCLCS